MAVKKMHNLVVAKPGRDGKKNWQQIGILMEMDDGRMSMKLESIPVGLVSDKDGRPVPWDGWVSVFPRDDNRSSTSGQTQQRSAGAPDIDDHIPF